MKKTIFIAVGVCIFVYGLLLSLERLSFVAFNKPIGGAMVITHQDKGDLSDKIHMAAKVCKSTNSNNVFEVIMLDNGDALGRCGGTLSLLDSYCEFRLTKH